MGAGLAFAPLAYFRGSLIGNVGLYLVAAAGFLLVLRILGTISARELRTLGQTLRLAKSQHKSTVEARP